MSFGKFPITDGQSMLLLIKLLRLADFNHWWRHFNNISLDMMQVLFLFQTILQAAMKCFERILRQGKRWITVMIRKLCIWKGWKDFWCRWAVLKKCEWIQMRFHTKRVVQETTRWLDQLSRSIFRGTASAATNISHWSRSYLVAAPYWTYNNSMGTRFQNNLNIWNDFGTFGLGQCCSKCSIWRDGSTVRGPTKKMKSENEDWKIRVDRHIFVSGFSCNSDRK